MFAEAAWFPMLALFVLVLFFIAVAGIFDALVATIPPTIVRTVAGLCIVGLAMAVVTSYLLALLVPAVDRAPPDCAGPPYEVCQ